MNNPFDYAVAHLKDHYDLTEEQTDAVLDAASPQMCCMQEPCVDVLKDTLNAEAAKYETEERT